MSTKFHTTPDSETQHPWLSPEKWRDRMTRILSWRVSLDCIKALDVNNPLEIYNQPLSKSIVWQLMKMGESLFVSWKHNEKYSDRVQGAIREFFQRNNAEMDIRSFLIKDIKTCTPEELPDLMIFPLIFDAWLEFLAEKVYPQVEFQWPISANWIQEALKMLPHNIHSSYGLKQPWSSEYIRLRWNIGKLADEENNLITKDNLFLYLECDTSFFNESEFLKFEDGESLLLQRNSSQYFILLHKGRILRFSSIVECIEQLTVYNLFAEYRKLKDIAEVVILDPKNENSREKNQAAVIRNNDWDYQLMKSARVWRDTICYWDLKLREVSEIRSLWNTVFSLLGKVENDTEAQKYILHGFQLYPQNPEGIKKVLHNWIKLDCEFTSWNMDENTVISPEGLLTQMGIKKALDYPGGGGEGREEIIVKIEYDELWLISGLASESLQKY